MSTEFFIAMQNNRGICWQQVMTLLQQMHRYSKRGSAVGNFTPDKRNRPFAIGQRDH